MSEGVNGVEKASFPATNNVKPFDVSGLYVVEVYTDMAAGEVRRAMPVTEDGVRDVSRPVRFFSSVTVNQGGRPFNVTFELVAKTLAEAIALYPEEAAKAGMAFLEKLQGEQVRRALAGRDGMVPVKPIVVPTH